MAETQTDDATLNGAPPDSLESLFAAQESALLLYARRLLNCEEAAQDVVQEAFVRLQTDFATVRQPRAWLYRTVHNLALNQVRADRKIVPLKPEAPELDETADPQPPPDEQLERQEAIGQARLCLATLEGRRRELIRLKFEEGLSYQEIGQRLNLSLSNVGYLLHQALKDLAEALHKAGVTR